MNLSITNKNKKNFALKKNSSIKEALKLISKNLERICFVVDNKNKLIGSISDGDIRRALIKGCKINEKVTNVYNKDFIFLQEGFSLNEAYKKFSGWAYVLPVVNKSGTFLGIIRKHDLVPFLDIRSKKVLVVGLGYVGLTLSLVLAEAGFQVKGIDKSKKIVELINNKKAPFYEKGMQGYLGKYVNKNFKVAIKLSTADIYVITVGTPFDKKNNSPDLSNLKKSIEEISQIIKKEDLIILRSTVPIGCTRKLVTSIIERKTKLRFGRDIFLAFCPERTIEGKAIEELKKLPQIIGSYCKKSSELAKRFFGEYNFTVVEVENLESAEMCKLIDNSYRDTMFAYSNQLALLSEKLNLNLPEILDKVNLGYARNKIPKPSPGVGGPCLTKDSYILYDNFKEQKINNPNIVLVSRKANESMINHIVERCCKKLRNINKKKNAKIFITGFAFKGNPETSDLRSSTTVSFLNLLKKKKFTNIWGHDFKIEKKEIEILGVKNCRIEDGFRDADAIFVMNNHKKYEDLDLINLIKKTNKPCLFFDSWQIFNPNEIKGILGITYASVGTN